MTLVPTKPPVAREYRSSSHTVCVPIGVYRLHLRALTPVSMPEYAGSTWRGAFGRALKQAACTTRQESCLDCPERGHCVYPNLFETLRPPQAQQMRRYDRIPVPLVLRPDLSGPTALKPGERTTLEFGLIANANRFLPQALTAFEQAARGGIGAGGGTLTVEHADQCSGPQLHHWNSVWTPGTEPSPAAPVSPTTPEWPGDVTLHFITPLRLTSDKRTLGPRDIAFDSFFGSLLRRVSMLAYFHTDSAHEADYAGLMAHARTLSFREAELRWHDWHRYSNHQGRHVPMGGVVGQVRLVGEAFSPLWPYLWIGQWIHAGKGAVMGLGRYALDATASLPNHTPTRH